MYSMSPRKRVTALVLTMAVLVIAVELIAVSMLYRTALEQERFRAAAMALVTQLAIQTGCDRVGLGLRSGRHTKIYAVSHTAQFGEQTNLVRAITNAMDEAIDQLETVLYPAEEGTQQVIRAHARLAEASGANSICTVVMSSGDEALAMLSRLSSKTHSVMTGVAVWDGQEMRSAISATDVRFREIDPDEARAYWQSGEPADKAGAYAIQGMGGVFVEEIRGSYSGVVGLPVFDTVRLLREAGIRVL